MGKKGQNACIGNCKFDWPPLLLRFKVPAAKEARVIAGLKNEEEDVAILSVFCAYFEETPTN